MADPVPGHGLPGRFHRDPETFESELGAIWSRSWLFAGPSVRVAEPGDFLRFDVADYSVVVVRDEAGELHALHNTCRHRGMPVCPEQHGRVRRWVCPYHQWSYGLDGGLLACGGMEMLVDGGLHRAEVVDVGGLVFVWLGPDPEPFDEARLELGSALAAQGLDRAKVAHEIDYEVRANWKLVWENNRECWHCTIGHPQYVTANLDVEDGLYPFPTPGKWWSANRTSLAPGFVTESMDGEPVAPLMGSYEGDDLGTLRLRGVPNFWCHASADHAVITRLAPAGPELTRIRVLWLVDRGAVEGRDYELERLLPFWQLTSEQDWDLCERNHAGVRNPLFTPGPLSPERESNVIAFIEWYLGRMRAAHFSVA